MKRNFITHCNWRDLNMQLINKITLTHSYQLSVRIFSSISLLILLVACQQSTKNSDKETFDAHVHIWNGEQSYHEYKAHLDSTGQAITRFGAIHMAVVGRPAHTRQKNNELIELAKKYEEVVPICSVHPLDGDSALAELNRLAALNVRALKLHPHTQNFDARDERMFEVCKQAGELGITILIDNANIKPGDNQALFDLAIRSPKTKFIFARMGGLEFRFWNILPLIRTANGFFADNIYFDISATVTLVANSPLEEEFIWTLRNVGIEHVLMGSDYPQFSLSESLGALEQLNLTREEKHKIRFLNAMELLFPDESEEITKLDAQGIGLIEYTGLTSRHFSGLEEDGKKQKLYDF